MEYKNCYIYVLNGLADWEIAYIAAELNSKRFIPKDIKVNIKFISKNLNSINTMGGVTITPEIEIAKVGFKAGDLLILPGSDNWDNINDDTLVEIVKNIEEKQIKVAAICGATVYLSKLDILNSVKHTSNDLEFLKLMSPDYSGEHLYINESVAVTDHLITASGLAPLEFTYEVFKSLEIMKEETLDNWYKLYKYKSPEFFYKLMNSI